nr:glycerol-3-phosphate 1-O-acyltransferase PlsY [bacterium]
MYWTATRLLLAMLAAYCMGMISNATIITKAHGINIREHGSGNPGGSNVLRILGARKGVFVMLLDCIKGLLAVLIAGWIGGIPAARYLGALAAVAGHNWPIVYGFRGGKGVASTLGVSLLLSFWPTLIGLGVHQIVLWTTRLMSLASMIAMTATLIAAWFFKAGAMYMLTGLVLWLWCIWQHRENIFRLVTGQEKPLWGGKKRAGAKQAGTAE